MRVVLLIVGLCGALSARAESALGVHGSARLIAQADVDAGTPPIADPIEQQVTPPPVSPPPVVQQKPALRGEWKPPAGLYLKEPPFSHRFPRIAVMFFLSGLSELAGAGLGAVTGCLVVPYGPQGCLPAFLYGGLIGGLLGIPIGVAAGGLLMDGNGSLFATFAGFLAGAAIDAALLAFVIYNIQTDPLRATFATIGFLLLPNAMAILAYELTSDRSRRYQDAIDQLKPQTVSVAPLLSPDRSGGMLSGISLLARF